MALRTISALSASALLALLGIVASSSAATAQDGTEEVAAVVEAAAPAAEVLKTTRVSGELRARGGPASIPVRGNGTLRVANGRLDTRAGATDLPDVGLKLPPEAAVSNAVAAVATDGTVVFSGEAAVDVAVQATDAGLRIQTVIADASAPTEYTYEFDEGLTPSINPDGSVDLLISVDGLMITSSTLAAPWAIDAAGASLETHYRVEGTSVIQVVEHGASVTYPVVADPNISSSCVWYGMCFVKFNRAYTNNIGAGTGTAAIVTGLTAASGGTLAPVAVVVGAKLGIDSIYANWVYNRGNCMAYRFPVTNWLNPMSWSPYEVKRGDYNCA